MSISSPTSPTVNQRRAQRLHNTCPSARKCLQRLVGYSTYRHPLVHRSLGGPHEDSCRIAVDTVVRPFYTRTACASQMVLRATSGRRHGPSARTMPARSIALVERRGGSPRMYRFIRIRAAHPFRRQMYASVTSFILEKRGNPPGAGWSAPRLAPSFDVFWGRMDRRARPPTARAAESAAGSGPAQGSRAAFPCASPKGT